MMRSLKRRSSVSLPRDCVKMDMISEEECGAIRLSAEKLLNSDKHLDDIWQSHNNKEKIIEKPHLVLKHLDRIGAEPGHSGSRVMLGYLVHGDDKAVRSHPMVVKVRRPVQQSRGGVRDILAEEDSQAKMIKSCLPPNPGKGHFATPVHFDEARTNRSYSVLWAPFVSSASQNGEAEDNLCKLLRSEIANNGTASPAISLVQIQRAYKLLNDFHNKSAVRRQRKIVREYDWYLRGFETSWGSRWREIWGGNSEVKYLTRKWANPWCVLKKLKTTEPISLWTGAVHGDLHPRNIVLSEYGPCFIDFAWAKNDAHITKDFALMECNLRFVILDPSVSLSSLETMAKWVDFKKVPPATGDGYCTGRAKLIGKLREIAKGHFPSNTNWDTEYTIPLFLTALGLLNHLPRIDNQIAARLTVLGLATYIDRKVLPNLKRNN